MLIDFWFGYEWSCVGGGNAGRFRGGGAIVFVFVFSCFFLIS